MDGFREASVKIGDMDVNVAVLYGTANVRKFLDRQRTNPKDYAFVEVMTCPGGCIGGGGQPKGTQEKGNALLKERIDGLYARDASMAPAKRASHENSEILALYQSFYGKPLSELAEKMLHTAYFDRSALLGEDAGKFQHYQDLHPGQDNTAGAAGDPAASAGVPGRILAHVRPENLNTVRVWTCTVCGEVHIGSEPPAECPVCHQGSSVFRAL